MRINRYMNSAAGPSPGARGAFWAWTAQDGQEAVLTLDGVIDTGESWFEDTTTPRAFREELERHEGEDITVRISSPGGDVFAGFDIYDMLKARRGGTRVVIPALCASAASIVAMAADPGELVMTRTGMMMIHQCSTMVCGNAEDAEKQADILRQIDDVLVSVYMERFAGTEAELRALLAAETYLTGAQAVDCGLADRVEDSAPAYEARYAACAQSVLDRLPERLAAMRRARAQERDEAARRRALLLEHERAHAAGHYNTIDIP